MVPWPIALLAMLYAVIATSSAAGLWKIAVGASRQSPLWPMGWLALSVAAMVGLSLLKSWGRRLAVIGLALIVITMLAVAALLVMAGRPLGGLLATVAASVHVVMIRYLQRPATKAYFGNAECGMRSAE